MALRCENISQNSRFFVALTGQKRCKFSLANTIVLAADND